MKRVKLLTWLSLVVMLASLVGACSTPTPAPAPSTSAAPAPKPAATSAPATTSAAPKPAASPSASPSPSPKPSSPSPAAAPKPAVIELKLTQHNPTESWATKNGFLPYAQRIEKATNGAVKVTVYSGGTLAPMGKAYDAVINGIADIGWDFPTFYPGRFPLAEVMALPFLGLPLDDKWYEVPTRVFMKLMEEFPEMRAEYKDTKILHVQAMTAYLVGTTKKPVRKLEDIKGLKIRMMPGIPADCITALGAVPVTVGMNDVYTSLEKGVIDGAGVNDTLLSDYKLQELIKYIIKVPLTAGEAFMVMNTGVWNKLSPDIQKAIMSVNDENGAAEIVKGTWDSHVPDIKKEVAEKYKIEYIDVSADEYNRWMKLGGKPIFDKWVADVSKKGAPGQKILDRTLALMEQYKKDYKVK